MTLARSLLALGLLATCLCLGAEIWLILRLLEIVPAPGVDEAAVQSLADTGKWIAGATTATLVVRWLLDRAARARRIGWVRATVLALAWLVAAAAVHDALQTVTDVIIDSLPDEARHDAVMIALYRKNVQDGRIGDLDFAPGPGGALDDLQRVKAINAAIGLLDHERDYARRSEGVLLDAADAKKAEIVAAGQTRRMELRQTLDLARAPFVALAEGGSGAEPARMALSAYQALWSAVAMAAAQIETPSDLTAALLRRVLDAAPEDPQSRQMHERIVAAAATPLVPAITEVELPALLLGDVPPALDGAGFGRFVADAIAARRDDAIWHIEDRVLTVLEEIDEAARRPADAASERRLVAAVVAPPLALSFGVIGVIANLTGVILLALALALAASGSPFQRSARAARLASVAAPWIVVAAVVLLSPPMPLSDGQQFARIAYQADAEDQLWSDVWVRLIGVEAALLSRAVH